MGALSRNDAPKRKDNIGLCIREQEQKPRSE
nr:MAG TPA: hypothetical protein [Caudoviricetes sp.]